MDRIVVSFKLPPVVGIITAIIVLTFFSAWFYHSYSSHCTPPIEMPLKARNKKAKKKHPKAKSRNLSNNTYSEKCSPPKDQPADVDELSSTSSVSSDDDSDDDLLRLASVSNRKASLKNKDKVVKEVKNNSKKPLLKSGSNRSQKSEATAKLRLGSTMEAIKAKTSSLSVTNSSSNSCDSTNRMVKEESLTGENLSETEIESNPLLLTMPSEIEKLFSAGESLLKKKKFEMAVLKYEEILEIPSVRSLSLDNLECLWLLMVWNRIALGNAGQGFLKNSILFHEKILQAIENTFGDKVLENKMVAEILINSYTEASSNYRSVGKIDIALEYNCRGKTIMENLVEVHGSVKEKKCLSNLRRNRSLFIYLQKALEGCFSEVFAIIKNPEQNEVTGENFMASDIYTYIDKATCVTFLMAASGNENIAFLNYAMDFYKQHHLIKFIQNKDLRGHTALAWACKFGKVQAIQLLLQNGASLCNLNPTEIKSWPPESLNTLQFYLKKNTNMEEVEIKKEGKKFSVCRPLSKNDLKEPVTKNKPFGINQKGNSEPMEKITPSVPAGKGSRLPKGFDAAPKSSAAINGELYGRELMPWTDDSAHTPLEELNLGSDEKRHWDQFETNKKLFGVTDTFKEEEYTTTLNTSKLSKEQLQKAETIAKEISRMKSTNSHMQEERGQIELQDADEDEEAKYGAVLGSGAYNSVKKLGAGVSAEDSFTDSSISTNY